MKLLHLGKEMKSIYLMLGKDLKICLDSVLTMAYPSVFNLKFSILGWFLLQGTFLMPQVNGLYCLSHMNKVID